MEVIVVGGGAAGVAAARALTAAGHRVAVLEARERRGGWTWTDPAPGWAFDRGAEWLHCLEHNPLAALAGDACAPWEVDERTHLGARWAGADEEAARAAFHQASYQAAWAAARAGHDDALARHLPGGPWAASFRQWLADDDGADPDELGVIDFARYVDTGRHGRVRGGLGALVASLARGLAVEVACAVTRVDWGGPRVRVHGARGVREADALVLAVPVPAYDAIRFVPALPDDKRAALDGLPLGARNKVALSFARAIAPAAPLYVHAEGPHGLGLELGREDGRAVVAHVGAARADQLERDGADATSAAALDAVAAVVGADARRAFTGAVATGWRGEPFIGGAYSHARPGCSGARAVLARPLAGRLFFAGEACSLDAYGTVHGAWASGEAAAAALMTAAGGRAREGAA